MHRNAARARSSTGTIDATIGQGLQEEMCANDAKGKQAVSRKPTKKRRRPQDPMSTAKLSKGILSTAMGGLAQPLQKTVPTTESRKEFDNTKQVCRALAEQGDDASADNVPTYPWEGSKHNQQQILSYW